MPSDSQPREIVVARLRPHARALFWPTLVLLVSIAALSYLTGVLREQWQIAVALAVAAVLIVVAWLLPLLAWLAHNYTITTRRIVMRRGIFVRFRQELLHSAGYDVTVRKNAIQSLFGSGDVQVNIGLNRPVVLRDVPSADLVQAALHDLMENSQHTLAARRQRDAGQSGEPFAR